MSEPQSPAESAPEHRDPPLAVLPRAVLDQLATTDQLLRGRAMLETHAAAAQAVPQSSQSNRRS